MLAMALQLSRPDPASPDDVAAASFSTARKGYEPTEVREFLHMVAAELARLHDRERALEQQVRDGQRNAFSIASLDDEVITRLLGDEASRILHSARDAAARLKAHTEEAAERMLREAGDEARRIREEAEIDAARRRSDTSADAQAELEMARQQGREMVEEAREYRERVLADVARRRELARRQIEQIVHGRARLIQAFERSRRAADEALAELGPLVGPDELDLSPTTDQVPVIEAAGEQTADRVEAPVQLFDRDADPDLAAESEAAAPVPVPAPVEAVEHIIDDEPTATIEPAGPVEAVEAVDAAVDDREPAPVINLFGSAPVSEPTTLAAPAASSDTSSDASPASGALRPSVDDLFAKLRAARTQGVAERATPTAADSAPAATPAAALAPDPSASDDNDDTPFTRRDDALAPLVTAAARKLKRALADEQNEVLHVLRGRQQVGHIANLVGEEAAHIARYAEAITGELTAAAVAGALSMGAGATAAQKDVKRSAAVDRAVAALADDIIRPLRDRLERCVATADGDRDELSSLVRPVYREWKNQRIDEHLDDVARVAFGHGALAGVAPGTSICWAIDPNGPACADAEDNTLGGVVAAGEAFPTEHHCAPAHPGCRCMIAPTAT
jgi:DivIVA domain-containing protein